jgi:hypothetical protein
VKLIIGLHLMQSVDLYFHSLYLLMAWSSINYRTVVGYIVHGIILLRDLNGAMRPDGSKYMSVHDSTCIT